MSPAAGAGFGHLSLNPQGTPGPPCWRAQHRCRQPQGTALRGQRRGKGQRERNGEPAFIPMLLSCPCAALPRQEPPLDRAGLTGRPAPEPPPPAPAPPPAPGSLTRLGSCGASTCTGESESVRARPPARAGTSRASPPGSRTARPGPAAVPYSRNRASPGQVSASCSAAASTRRRPMAPSARPAGRMGREGREGRRCAALGRAPAAPRPQLQGTGLGRAPVKGRAGPGPEGSGARAEGPSPLGAGHPPRGAACVPGRVKTFSGRKGNFYLREKKNREEEVLYVEGGGALRLAQRGRGISSSGDMSVPPGLPPAPRDPGWMISRGPFKS